jgi:YHS domain-containing protein
MSDQFGDTPTSHILREDRSSLRFDPVCGVPVNPASAVTDVWDGNTYFFHSVDCRRRFEDHPVAFVPGAREPGPVQEVR